MFKKAVRSYRTFFFWSIAVSLILAVTRRWRRGLYRITVNHCRSWKRRWARRFQWFRRIGGGDKNGNGPAIGDLPESRRPAINAQTRQLIDQTLNQLSDQARMVFVLRELENLSYAEIAYVSGINSETVRSRLFHTRRQLRTLLASVKAEEGPK